MRRSAGPDSRHRALASFGQDFRDKLILGRSSGSRIGLPATPSRAPRRLPSRQRSGVVAFVPGYSGGTATDLHRFPYSPAGTSQPAPRSAPHPSGGDFIVNGPGKPPAPEAPLAYSTRLGRLGSRTKTRALTPTGGDGRVDAICWSHSMPGRHGSGPLSRAARNLASTVPYQLCSCARISAARSGNAVARSRCSPISVRRL